MKISLLIDFPDVGRLDAGLVVVSELTVNTPRAQRAAADAAIAMWDRVPWPQGLLSHSALLGLDGYSVLHWLQWTGEADYEEFQGASAYDETQSPLEQGGTALYRPLRTTVTKLRRTPPEYIGILSAELDSSSEEHQRHCIEGIRSALSDTEAAVGHFHVSIDGRRLLHYAESAQPAAQAPLTPEWRLLGSVPGTRRCRFKRYYFYRTLACYRTGNCTLWRQVSDSRYLSRRASDVDSLHRLAASA